MGSGKTTLLKGILGEIKYQGNYHYSVNTSCSFVSQKPWIRNATVRENILFGEEFNEKKY